MSAQSPIPSGAGYVPPSNIDVEKIVLGTVIMQPAAFHIISSITRAEHFSENVFAEIWATIETLAKQGRPIALSTISANFLEKPIEGQDWTISQILAHLCVSAMPIISIKGFAETLFDIAARRSIIEAAQTAIRQAMNMGVGGSPVELAGDTIAELGRIVQGKGVSTRRTVGDAAADLIETAAEQAAQQGKRKFVSTGLPDLNNITGGFEGGKLWIVAGRPGMGKSTALVGFAENAAKSGGGALVFQLEVEEKEMTARFLASNSYAARKPLYFGEIMRGEVGEGESWRLREAQERLASIPLVIDTAPGLSVAEIIARTKGEKASMARNGHVLKVIFIDQLDFIKATDRYRGQKVHEVGEVTRELKRLAKEEDVCVVLFSQLNRTVENRSDKRPQLSDLRDSGNIEQDADVVVFLYRESYYLERSEAYQRGDENSLIAATNARDKIEFILGKNRAGKTPTLTLWCEIGCSKIASRSQS